MVVGMPMRWTARAISFAGWSHSTSDCANSRSSAADNRVASKDSRGNKDKDKDKDNKDNKDYRADSPALAGSRAINRARVDRRAVDREGLTSAGWFSRAAAVD